MSSTSIPLLLTAESPCSYLNAKQQLAFVNLSPSEKALYYPALLEQGFRRGGQELYRPYCKACNQCQSLRVKVADFAPSRSQKRLLNKLNAFQVSSSKELIEQDFSLYQRYIEVRHRDGDMYPARQHDFEQFLGPGWQDPLYLRLFLEGKLAVTAVCDRVGEDLSAVYTYFDPSLSQLSPGKLAILAQIRWLQEQQGQWLYLGYQVDECQKMNYKASFRPHQRFIEQKWQQMN